MKSRDQEVDGTELAMRAEGASGQGGSKSSTVVPFLFLKLQHKIQEFTK